MNNNSMIFIETNEKYYIGIFIETLGEIEYTGRKLINHYDYEKTLELVCNKYSLLNLADSTEDSIKNRLTNEYYVAALHERSLKNRECFKYDSYDQLIGKNIQNVFIPYTKYKADYVYLKKINSDWLVSHELSDYEFEDLETNVSILGL